MAETEVERWRRIAEENARAEIAKQAAAGKTPTPSATAKHAEVIAQTARDGMAKQQAALAAQRPALTTQQQQYEQHKRDEAIRQRVRDGALANDAAERIRQEVRRDNEALANPPVAKPQVPEVQKAATVQAEADARKTIAERLTAMRTEAERLQAAHDVTHPEGATAQRTQYRRDAAQAMTERRQQQAQRDTAAQKASGQMLLPSERLRLLREEARQADIAKQLQRGQDARQARSGALTAERFGELSDRRREAGDRANRQETTDRAARAQTRELTSDDSEARQNRKNNGKRGRGETEIEM